jgi:hypothetical protein
MNSRFFLGMSIIFISSMGYSAATPIEVMQAVQDRYKGDNWIIKSDITLLDKKGRRSDRVIQTYGKKNKQDEKTLTRVLAPAKLLGTGFLTFDWNDYARENESWLFLPDLGKVTRLSGANLADYFLGSDFTYGDVEELEVRDFTYRYTESSSSTPIKSNNKLVVIIAEPNDYKKKNKYGYEKIQYWVDSEKNLIVKAKYSLKEKGWAKYYSVTEIENIDGVWMGKKEQMVMVYQNKKVHTSVIQHASIDINPGVAADYFTIFSLEQGR